MTCLAVWAAMRPKSSGVSSHSRTTFAVLVELLAVDPDLSDSGSTVTTASSAASGQALVGGDERVGQGVEECLDRDALVGAIWPSASRNSKLVAALIGW